jgi:hydroxyacylglutathione hydrolase
MELIAPGVWKLSGWLTDMFNAYLVGDVLIDTTTRWARRPILRQLQGRAIRLVALTHCHPDHQGLARVVCRKYRIPLACHAADVTAVEGRAPMLPDNRFIRWAVRWCGGPPHPVARVLRHGDVVAGFRVVHAPGHTPGHILFFRDADRVAIAGDVLANIHFLTRKPGLREPPAAFSADAAENRRSIRKLIALRPAVVCFGHGPPLRDLSVLDRFAARWR